MTQKKRKILGGVLAALVFMTMFAAVSYTHLDVYKRQERKQ